MAPAVVQAPSAGDAARAEARAEDEPLPGLLAPWPEGPHLEEPLEDAAALRQELPDHAAGVRPAQGLRVMGGRANPAAQRPLDLEAVQPELRPRDPGLQQLEHEHGGGEGPRAQAWGHPALRAESAAHLRLQVRPPDLRGGRLLRPSQGVHQRRGPRPPGHREVLGLPGHPGEADHAPHELLGEQGLPALRPESGRPRRGGRRGQHLRRAGRAWRLQVVAGRASRALQVPGPGLRCHVRPHQGPRDQDAHRCREPHPGRVDQGAGGRGGRGLVRAGSGRCPPRQLLRDVRLRRPDRHGAEALVAGGQHLPLALLRLAAGQAHQDQARG
mmetsp:Transcript_67825/g.209865  ORF Transcript_67825/g.209865 Transcript_67825/m.209865 type:complete len:328 (+) Transcript_67825:393-1376(+)